MDNSPEKESPDAPAQLRALADDKMASTCAYESDLRRAAHEIERLRYALHATIARPAGVVPDCALEFYDPMHTGLGKMAQRKEARR